MEFAFIYCRMSASLCRQTDCTFRYHNVGNDLFLQMSTCSLMPTIFSHSTTIHRLKKKLLCPLSQYSNKTLPQEICGMIKLLQLTLNYKFPDKTMFYQWKDMFVETIGYLNIVNLRGHLKENYHLWPRSHLEDNTYTFFNTVKHVW